LWWSWRGNKWGFNGVVELMRVIAKNEKDENKDSVRKYICVLNFISNTSKPLI